MAPLRHEDGRLRLFAALGGQCMANLSRLRDWGLLIFCNLVWGCQFVI